MKPRTVIIQPRTRARQSRPYSAVPGDTQRVLTRPAVTVDGVDLPAGTRYQPQSSGYGACGRLVARIFVLGGSAHGHRTMVI